MEKLDQLQERLDTVKYLKEILDSETPLRKGLKAPSESSEKEVLSFLKSCITSKISELLGEPDPTVVKDFDDEEIMLLKAMCLKHKNNPKVQQVLKKEESAPSKKPAEKKPEQPVRGGRRGKIIDPTEIAGLTGDEYIDPGTEIVALARHSVEGYWQVVLASNSRVKFVISEDAIEWLGEK